jgi:hypothetical protein
MNRLRMTLVGLTLALGLAAVPLAHSAFAAHSGGSKAKHGAVVTKTTTQQATALKGNGVVAYVASALGVTPTVLQADLKVGQTLLQIAGSKYASADALATALLAPVKTNLDQATSSNKLSATQAGALYTQAHTAVAKLVVTPHPALGAVFAAVHGARGQHGAGARFGLLTVLTTACNTNATALNAAITTGGKTLLAICQATNSSVTQTSLVSTLLASMKTKLDQAVSAKTITAAQESTALTQAQAYLTNLVTTPIPAGGLHLHK